jgi:hypothetical protein
VLGVFVVFGGMLRGGGAGMLERGTIPRRANMLRKCSGSVLSGAKTSSFFR